jgi:hypothetical protein
LLVFFRGGLQDMVCSGGVFVVLTLVVVSKRGVYDGRFSAPKNMPTF